ncbi:MAG: hypothetical protein U0Q16_25005 [Bryobacteraceae bacterium]
MIEDLRLWASGEDRSPPSEAIMMIALEGLVPPGVPPLRPLWNRADDILRSTAPPKRIVHPPSSWLLTFASHLCRKTTNEAIKQMVADLRAEYFDTLKEGRRWKAEWIKLLHYVAIARALSIDRALGWLINYSIGIIRGK